jgi:hypothetical protein
MFNIINKFNGSEKEIDINDDEEKIENVDEVEEENIEDDENIEDENIVDEDIEKENVDDEEEENIEDRKYIISVDGIPYYYHNEIDSARRFMWSIGNNFITKNSNFYDIDEDINVCEYYITTNDLNNIKVMKTYDFFFFTYSSIVNEIKIDYVIPCKI